MSPIVYRPTGAHYCEPPVKSLDIPFERPGTVWQCSICGALWEVREPPRVYSGSQRVPNEWVRLTRWESWRFRRTKRRAKESTPTISGSRVPGTASSA